MGTGKDLGARRQSVDCWAVRSLCRTYPGVQSSRNLDSGTRKIPHLLMQALLDVVQITVDKCSQTLALQQIEARVEMLANRKIFILSAFQAF